MICLSLKISFISPNTVIGVVAYSVFFQKSIKKTFCTEDSINKNNRVRIQTK